MNQACRNLLDVGFLKSIGFIVNAHPRDLIGPDSNIAAAEDDHFANLQGQAFLVLAGLRTRRGLWLTRGWPCNMARALQCEENREDLIKIFRKDYEIWKKLSLIHI